MVAILTGKRPRLRGLSSSGRPDSNRRLPAPKPDYVCKRVPRGAVETQSRSGNSLVGHAVERNEIAPVRKANAGRVLAVLAAIVMRRPGSRGDRALSP
jgi:hypothetical protein